MYTCAVCDLVKTVDDNVQKLTLDLANIRRELDTKPSMDDVRRYIDRAYLDLHQRLEALEHASSNSAGKKYKQKDNKVVRNLPEPAVIEKKTAEQRAKLEIQTVGKIGPGTAGPRQTETHQSNQAQEAQQMKPEVAVAEQEICIDGYSFCSYLEDNGRGCPIYTKNDLAMLKLDAPKTNTIEAIGVTAHTNAGPINLICAYKLLSQPISITDINTLLRENASAKGDLLCMGDFNLPKLKWTSTESSNHSFVEFIKDPFLKQHVAKSTRYREGKTENILELMLPTNPDSILDVKHLRPLEKSEHCCLMTTITAPSSTKRFQCSKREYACVDSQKYREEIQAVDWELSKSQKVSMKKWPS
ncbi:hypothetical protein QYM36_016966 [Artemia franciscana]|uniref:Endonuclease/exonuclease/phosphatase domain-containing protein n=1 Tax=Artemia franciscana TaxID=6661 RepID=A0AA88H4L9_ARTSF|nr:hypothetical protein QYM36_016966 [Artemia franciscana]